MENEDYRKLYVNFLKSYIKVDKPLNVVFDASNGPTGAIVKELFEGSHIKAIVINDDIDPDFKAHGPNPISKAATDNCAKVMKKNDADLGVVFDADGDRAVFVNDKGKTLPAYLVAALLFKQTSGLCVADELVYRSLRMLDFIPEKDLVPSRVGTFFLKDEMKKKGAIFGAEFSGHYYFKDFFNLDSGIFTAITVVNTLSKMRKSLSEEMESFSNQEIISKEIKIAGKDLAAIFKRIEEKYASLVKEIGKRDGLTLVFSDFWINIRPSNTEPVLRIVAGGKSPLAEKMDEVIVLI